MNENDLDDETREKADQVIHDHNRNLFDWEQWYADERAKLEAERQHRHALLVRELYKRMSALGVPGYVGIDPAQPFVGRRK